MKDLRNKCHFIEPLYEPVVQPFQYQDKEVIVIWVAGGYGRPYKAPKSPAKDASYKRYYIRKYSSTVIASPDEEKQLFYISSNIPFDDRPNLAVDITDLDIGLMREYLSKVDSSLYRHSLNYTSVEIAKDLQIISGPTEELRLIEGRNTGFPNTFQALKENGSELPVFRMDFAVLMFSVLFSRSGPDGNAAQ